ncbi:MAG: hypothetical protein K5755_04090 [Clostridiales bacterium]|nr:hypothetical protein [Clostridiales bacterium]
MAEENKNNFLSDLNKYDEGRVWSLDEIDALLGGEIVHEEPLEIEKQLAEEKRREEAAENEGGQLAFAEVDIPESVPEEEEITVEETKPAEGQISFEKTRVFNEVDTSAGYNINIEHNITDQRVVHTTTGRDDNIVQRSNRMESDKIRERFINPPVKDIEKTAEHRAILDKLPPKTIERAGFFVEEGTNSSTSDLDPLPTIVSADSVMQNQRADDLNEEIHENQITFEGFNEEEEIEKVDEYEAETELIRRRREKAKNFKLFPNLPEDGETEDGEISDENAESDENDDFEDAIDYPEENAVLKRVERRKKSASDQVIEREFYGAKDKKGVEDLLEKKRRGALIQMIISAVAFAVLTVMSLLASNGDFTFFSGRVEIFLMLNIAVLVIACCASLDIFKSGILGLFGRKANTDSAVFVAFVAAVIQNGISFAFTDSVETSVHIYSAAAAFTLLLNTAARFVKAKSIEENFGYISQERDFYTVKSIEDEDASFEIGRGLFLGDPDIRYNAMTAFEEKYVENSSKTEPAATTVMRAIPVTAILAVVIGAITGVIMRDIPSAIAAFTGTVCLASPVGAFLASAWIFSSMSKKLTDEDALIVGYESADELTKANAVVFDAAELFDTENCKSFGFKTFNSMRPDEAMLYTGAVMIAAGGPLANLFRLSVIGDRDVFPTVENLNYEDKLGCSAWVEHNKRVLVGNRELLINHNVEVLDKEYELKLKRSGRQIIYLAVEHVLSAIYVVGYTPDIQVASLLRKLEKNSLPILVRTTDQNITEEFIEESFILPKNSVKVISSVAGEMFSDIYETISEKDSSGVMHDGTTKSFLKAFNSAYTLMARVQIASILQYIGVGLGVLIMSLMAFFSALMQGGALQLCIFQIIWTAVTILIPKIKK